MKIKHFKTLEFTKVLELLAEKAITSLGKEQVLELMPSTELKEVNAWQTLTESAYHMALKKGSIPLGGAKDIYPALKRVSAGGVLNITELLYVMDFIHACKKVKNYAKAENQEDIFPVFDPYFEDITIPTQLDSQLNKAIQNETELKDDASPKLYDIRISIKQANSKIKEMLGNIIQSAQYRNMLQDAVITIRSGRYCVPIKQEYKTAFQGVVHDQSATGATVFMEPMSVVNLNNRIKELGAQEKEETEKILRHLSLLVEENKLELTHNLETITQLDVIFAKGELALAWNGIKPKFNDQGHINIDRGRHPLLDEKKVVPLDIYLGQDFKTLLITGPNTGGKTVALKTLGLFTLMGQTGMHIPARDAQLTVFDHVFADIGDEQSIEQSLSTFSSHMTNIVKILEEATHKSLVLMDELGAGTDPTEGAALAIAIIDYLREKGSTLAVTTHYSELKLYAISTPGVENAACEFDVNTLAPTYKLLIGVAGKSNAFAISKKLGLSPAIIDMAKTHLDGQDIKVEDVLTDIEMSKKIAQVEQERARQYREQASHLKKELDTEREKTKLQKEKILERAKEQARILLLDAEETATKVLKEINAKARALGKEDTDKLKKGLRDKAARLAPKEVKRKAPKSLAIGDSVFIHSLNQSGIVASLPDPAGNVEVKAGIMKIKVKTDQLSLENPDPLAKTKPKGTHKSNIKTSKALSVRMELDIRGHMVDEGIEKLSKYLDDVMMSNLKQVTIIHGKGTGALRTGIQKYLERNPYVKSFRAGEFGEGDAGVTVVTIK